MEDEKENNELEFKTLDKIPVLNEINSFNGMEISEDGFLCIITNLGLYFFHLRGYMSNFLKIFSFSKLFLKPSDYSISDSLEIDPNSFVDDIPRYDLYEVLLRPDMYPQLKNYGKSQPLRVKFSPPGLISQKSCAVAVLTNFGSLEIYLKRVKINSFEEYHCFCNISQCLISFYKNSWRDVSKRSPEEILAQFKERVNMITPLSFAWSHLVKIENSVFCILIVGHADGVLTFWKINSQTVDNCSLIVNSDLLLERIQLPFDKVSTLEWVKADNDGLLLVGDSNGKVIGLCVYDIREHSLAVSEKIVISDEKDLIKVDIFKVFRSNEKILLFVVKRVHVMIIALDKQGKIVDKAVVNVDNLQITALEPFENDTYFVLTYTGIFIQLKVTWENEKLKLFRRYIHLKINFSMRRGQGLYISPNKVFICIVAPLYKLVHLRRTKKIIKVFVLKNCSKNPLKILLENQTESIANYWDCFEVLRMTSFIERKLPIVGLPQNVDYDTFSLTKLKTYYWLAKCSETIIDKVCFINEYNIKSSEELKVILKINMTIKHMEDLFKLQDNQNEFLTKFQMTSMYLHNLFLKEIVYNDMIEKFGLGENVIKSMTQVLRKSNGLKYPEAPQCFICAEKLVSYDCPLRHENNRCSISDVQIIWPPYYKCMFCKSNVHKEVENEYCPLLCPFCDVPMSYINDYLIKSPNEIQRKLNIFDTNSDISKLDCDDLQEVSAEGPELFNISDDSDSEEEMEVEKENNSDSWEKVKKDELPEETNDQSFEEEL